MNCKTREEYFTKAINYCRNKMFVRHGKTIPVVRVSVGFPAGTRPSKTSRQAIGQYWGPEKATDGIAQIFISPTIDNPIEALSVLVHELCHACTPGDGHGKVFRALANSIGLIGPAKTTIAGPSLKPELEALSKALGDYPHSALNLDDRKKQPTRLIKCQCILCGYIAYTTQKWLNKCGAPLCPATNAESPLNRMEVKS